MTSRQSVVVTGIGVVSAAGCGTAPFAATLATSDVIRTPIDRSAGYHREESSRTAILSGGADLSDWISPLKARRMSQPSKQAVAAANIAVAQSSLESNDLNRAAIVVATSYGAADVTENILRQAMLEGPESVSPALFTESVANAPAAQVAMALKARGPNLTIVQRQAGPLIALAQGVSAILSGRSSIALVGAVDEVNPLMHSILDRFRALAKPGDDGVETARPFDQKRSGFLAGDGAAVVILETEEAARERGARPLVRIRMTGRAFDPTAPRTSWSQDHGSLSESMKRSLLANGVGLAGIDRLVTGGCGIGPGDRIEALVLRSLFGDVPLPPVLAPKGVTGESGGGFLAAAVLAATGSPFGPTPGFTNEDPELGVIPHDGRSLSDPAAVLASGFAAGGAAAWALLEPVKP
jgi:3-oxoacyl-(acyl-carrier-protein) synthase